MAKDTFREDLEAQFDESEEEAPSLTEEEAQDIEDKLGALEFDSVTLKDMMMLASRKGGDRIGLNFTIGAPPNNRMFVLIAAGELADKVATWLNDEAKEVGKEHTIEEYFGTPGRMKRTNQ